MIIAQTPENLGRRCKYRILDISLYFWPRFPSETVNAGVQVDQPNQAMVKGLSSTGLNTFFAFCFSEAFFARWVLAAETVRASAI